MANEGKTQLLITWVASPDKGGRDGSTCREPRLVDGKDP